MLRTFAQILAEDDLSAITSTLETALEHADESPFWAQKVPPFAEAVLSVLVPLRDQGLLFDPEGNPKARLDAALVLRWCDLVSLKTLAFTLQKSNDAGKLLRTKHDGDTAGTYRPVDLGTLAAYLATCSVDLENEQLDFPIAQYNLHLGIADILKKLMQ
jgi:hypothetical protein